MVNCRCKDSLEDWTFECFPNSAKGIIGILAGTLAISLFWNIFFCASIYRSRKGDCRSKSRRRQSSRQMEDNPIYGNLNYTETSMVLYTDSDPPHSSFNVASLRDQHRVNSASENQDCYANLTLKAPRVQSGCSSPQIQQIQEIQEIQYSDVVHLEVVAESEKEDDLITDDVSTMSDLYASVQTHRTKTIDTADGEEGYANHL